jgi:hypothetical protein
MDIDKERFEREDYLLKCNEVVEKFLAKEFCRHGVVYVANAWEYKGALMYSKQCIAFINKEGKVVLNFDFVDAETSKVQNIVINKVPYDKLIRVDDIRKFWKLLYIYKKENCNSST